VGLCVLTSGASRQAERLSGGIQHGLQSVLQVYRGTHKDRVTLVQLGDDQCSDQCQQGVLRERPSHTTDLAQCCKTRSDGVDDLGPHQWRNYGRQWMQSPQVAPGKGAPRADSNVFLFCLITKFCHVLWLPMTLHSIHFAQYAHALPLTIIS